VSLRNYKWREVVKFLTKHEHFAVTKITGSHYQLAHADGRHTTVPRHDPLKEKTLKAILDQTNVSKDKFVRLA
jgi:predicted RNA binding protein YcfA (HicA-like mRNA interferase family)